GWQRQRTGLFKFARGRVFPSSVRKPGIGRVIRSMLSSGSSSTGRGFARARRMRMKLRALNGKHPKHGEALKFRWR
ncbi:MAG: hypothetical protein O3C21_20795, partial [Verrucomicrobia bacterium]|nr:hypothetical protein [Verrucomicrobiota bacterium]